MTGLKKSFTFLTGIIAAAVSIAAPSDVEKFEALHARALVGDPGAQHDLAWCYRDGKGAKRNLILAAEWFRRSADIGHAGSECALGTMLLFGEGMPKDELAGVRLLEKSANKGFPAAQYFLGLCYKHGLGVSEDLGSWERWQARAALNGYTRISEVSEDESRAISEWKASYDEAYRHFERGQNAKARVAANDALDLANSKLGEKHWYGVAASELLLRIAIRSEDWPEVYKRLHTAQRKAMNAYFELVEIPSGIVIPGYLLSCTKKLVMAKIMPDGSEEKLRVHDEMLRLITKEFDKVEVAELVFLPTHTDLLAKLGKSQEADVALARCVSICRKYMSDDKDLMCLFLGNQAVHLGRTGRFEAESKVRTEIFSFYARENPSNYAHMGAKLDLLKALVLARVQKGETFTKSENLPRGESALRRLADEGDPMACFRLSVGLSSGEFRSKVGVEHLELLPESMLYRRAAIAPFMDESRLIDHLDLKATRRFAKLGNGFALYELASHLKRQNKPWPPVSGMVDGKELYNDVIEHTHESYGLLRQAADAGVPEAVHELAYLAFYGQYDEYAPPEKGNPFVGQDGNWYQHRYVPGSRGQTELIQRLSNDPVTVRRDLAMAAHYLRRDIIIGMRSNSAFLLAQIHARGAPESSGTSMDTIRFPAIIPDRVESAAYLHVCILTNNLHADEAKAMLLRARLTAEQSDEALRRAKEILESRVRG